MSNETGGRQETFTCDKHGEYLANVFYFNGGRLNSVRCPKCQAEAQKKAAEERERYAAHLEARRLEQIAREIEAELKNCGIPPRFTGRTFDSYQLAETSSQARAAKLCRAYADGFPDRLKSGSGLLLLGKPGTGKTHLSCSILESVVRQGFSGKYLGAMDAIGRIKETWGRDSRQSEAQAIAELAEPDLLVLDEVGIQHGTETEKMLLFQVINRRYETIKPTILISNLPENELAVYIGERALDRLMQDGGAIVPFTWESWRRKQCPR